MGSHVYPESRVLGRQVTGASGCFAWLADPGWRGRGRGQQQSPPSEGPRASQRVSRVPATE